MPLTSCMNATWLLLLVVFAQSAHATSARVTYVAGGSAYVDAGSADGVVSGASLEVAKKRGKPVTCTVVDVAAHHALCNTDARLSAGDRVTFVAQTVVHTNGVNGVNGAKPAAPHAPPAGALDAIAREPAPHVTWKKPRGSSRPAWAGRGSITLRQQVWATTDSDGTFARPSLDALAHAGIGIFPGLYAESALRVQGDVLAPASERFRPGEAQLYLWNASIGKSEGAVVGALGRFRPRRAPGMQLLDGAQVGFTSFGGALELGGYAGAIPDAVTLGPSLDRVTAGAYFAVDVAVAKDVLVLPRARVGLVSTPDGRTVRAEAEAEAQLLWAGFAVGASARVGAGGSADPLPSLDAARVDVDGAPLKSLRVHGGWRYLAPLAVEWDAGLPPVGGAHHGDLSGRYAVDDWLVVGADSGVGIDVVSDVARGYAGPVLGFPRALGSVGGVELGYLEELASPLQNASTTSWAGRSAYISSTVVPLDALRVTTRVSYFEDAAANDSLRALSLMAWADAPILSWLSVRLRAQGEQTLAPLDGSARKSATTFVGDLSLTGSL